MNKLAKWVKGCVNLIIHIYEYIFTNYEENMTNHKAFMSIIFYYLSFLLLMLQKRFMGDSYFALEMSVSLCVSARVCQPVCGCCYYAWYC